MSSRVRGRPMHEFVGQFVVVLQRVDERGGIDPEFQGGAQGQPQELGVGGGQGVLVGGPVDEVVGQIGAGLRRSAGCRRWRG